LVCFFFSALWAEKKKSLMEGSADQWHLITPFLSIVDLCRLMRVSKKWFYLWIADRAWIHHRIRICNRFPNLNSVFDAWCKKGAVSEHYSKRSQNVNTIKRQKTRKKAWGTPRRGIWYVFKNWLMMGTSLGGIRKLCQKEETHPIALAVFLHSIPTKRENIVETWIEYFDEGYLSFQIIFYTKKFRIRFYQPRHKKKYYVCLSPTNLKGVRLQTESLYYRECYSGWRHYLLRNHLADPWTQHFENLLKE